MKTLRPKRVVRPRRPAGILVAIAGFLLAATSSPAQTESAGNTDGVLTWSIGDLAPGGSARRVVLFAFDRSLEAAAARLEEARRHHARPAEPAEIPPEGSAPGLVWIRNEATDFALEGPGRFYWEGRKQSLAGPRGGQLSRFGYYILYDVCDGEDIRDGEDAKRRAGTPITNERALENLRIVEPMRAARGSECAGIVETADGRIRVRIRAAVGPGPAAAVEFAIENIGPAALADVRLSAYANLEANHDHENDYAVLDRKTASHLTVDIATGACIAMAGLEPPAGGHSGVWASEGPLREGAGAAFATWREFGGIPRDLAQRLGRATIPHPPAPYAEPSEPDTRTLAPAEAAAILEADWLFQAEGKPLAARAREEIGWARDLAARILEKPGAPDLAGELAALDDLRARIEGPGTDADPDAARSLYFDVRRIKRRIAFANPIIDFTRILFIDNPYPQGAEWPHQARHRNGMMAVPGGRLLVLDGLHPGGAIRKLAPERPGSFWRPDLSFDAERILFCYKAHDEGSFHVYEIGIDGAGLRQVTRGEYDDIDPIYLPDGRILFSTTRCNTYVRCMPYTYSYVLARCDADGSNIYLLSTNNEPDWCPALLEDGTVIYSRWEYTDKALWRIQSLWTTNPDGTNTVAFWGNQSVWPDHLAEPRPIPGGMRVMFTGLAHHDWFAGSIGIIDRRKGYNFPRGLTKVTRDVPWPECGAPPVDPGESDRYHTAGAFAAYKTPYPLSDDDFLVSARAAGRIDPFRLYLMDVYGNRELIYRGAYNVWHAVPVRIRAAPPARIDRVVWPGTGAERTDPEPAVFFSADVYEGVPDLPRGAVKALRVLQIDAKTFSTWTRDSRYSGPGTSSFQDDGVKRILGTAPVEPDGSVHFKAPPGRSLHFQLLDERGRAVQTMRTFTNAMPGERRGCVGCHEMTAVTPPARADGLALRRPPSDLEPPSWGTKSIRYEEMVQPVLDRHCGRCHQGDGEGRKTLDLTLRPGNQWFFKEPYLSLVGKGWGVADPKGGGPSIAGAMLIENYPQSEPASYLTFRPMRHLSSASRLIRNAMSGEHHGVKVDPVGLEQLIGWVDANCPFRGEEDLRAIPDPSFAGIDLLPVRPRCETAPDIPRP
ncbi:MAG: hypothetical protein JXP34_28200 [Planctomycetes bacterium]|nr:hypothetical protein [Planctomycetota bacterium]